jgi:hypothetical protein
MNFFVFIARKRWEMVATLWVGEREDALWEEGRVALMLILIPYVGDFMNSPKLTWKKKKSRPMSSQKIRWLY